MGIAMAITSVAAPLVMDEDLDPTIVLYVRAVSIGLAFMMLLLFAFLPGTPKAKHKKVHLKKSRTRRRSRRDPASRCQRAEKQSRPWHRSYGKKLASANWFLTRAPCGLDRSLKVRVPRGCVFEEEIRLEGGYL